MPIENSTLECKRMRTFYFKEINFLIKLYNNLSKMLMRLYITKYIISKDNADPFMLWGIWASFKQKKGGGMVYVILYQEKFYVVAETNAHNVSRVCEESTLEMELKEKSPKFA